MKHSKSSTHRAVVTGFGVVSPLGSSAELLWSGLQAGQSGIVQLPNELAHSLPVQVGAPCTQFSGQIEDFGALAAEQKKSIRKALKLMCRECQMGVAAAQLALQHAQASSPTCAPEMAGVLFGCDYLISEPEEFVAAYNQTLVEDRFEFSRWGKEGMSKITPLWLLKYLPNMPASHVAIYNDFRGPNNSITQRESSGLLAVGEAARYIERGHAQLVVAGATGSRLHPVKSVHIAQREELANGHFPPSGALRPFDLERDGTVPGEAAACVVLESRDSAVARGAAIWGEVLGVGSSCVWGSGQAARRDLALANALRSALKDADMAPGELGHVHAHGLGTRSCDHDEALAIRSALQQAADHVPTTAIKGHVGNVGAAGGVLSLIASAMAIKHGQLFPAKNCEARDPACQIRVAQDWKLPPGQTAACLSVTQQAQACCVIIRGEG